jgi:ribosomal-protein-alanine N-acetyltransferase
MSARPARTMAGLVFRPAVPNDLDAIAAIERASFSDPWNRASFAGLLDREHLHFIVATRGGAVVAFAIAYAAGGEAEIANIAVATEARGQGTGSMLLRHLLSELTDAGTLEVWLEVRASNDAARALYARFGFSEVGQRRKYYVRPVEDAISMRCRLADATK